MKDSLSLIIVIASLVLVAGIRLYRKYYEKEKNLKEKDETKRGSGFMASTAEDDYEPYSKK
ncbi:MAG: hypothetical protein ACUVTX_05355 [Bacteroidales bacterium]